MKNIEIIHTQPEIYSKLKNKFGVNWDDGIIIAFDNKIYCKYKDIPPQKIYHESIHLEEQNKIGNDAWWEAYLDSDEFRLQEELKAYKAEAAFIKKAIKNKNDCFEMLRIISHDLSSSIYGNIITPDEAFRLIK